MKIDFELAHLPDRLLRMFCDPMKEAGRMKAPTFAEHFHHAMNRELTRRAEFLPALDEPFELPDPPENEMPWVIVEFRKLGDGFEQMAADLRESHPSDPKSVREYDAEQAGRFEATAKFCHAIAVACKNEPLLNS